MWLRLYTLGIRVPRAPCQSTARMNMAKTQTEGWGSRISRSSQTRPLLASRCFLAALLGDILIITVARLHSKACATQSTAVLVAYPRGSPLTVRFLFPPSAMVPAPCSPRLSTCPRWGGQQHDTKRPRGFLLSLAPNPQSHLSPMTDGVKVEAAQYTSHPLLPNSKDTHESRRKRKKSQNADPRFEKPKEEKKA